MKSHYLLSTATLPIGTTTRIVQLPDSAVGTKGYVDVKFVEGGGTISTTIYSATSRDGDEQNTVVRGPLAGTQHFADVLLYPYIIVSIVVASDTVVVNLTLTHE